MCATDAGIIHSENLGMLSYNNKPDNRTMHLRNCVWHRLPYETSLFCIKLSGRGKLTGWF